MRPLAVACLLLCFLGAEPVLAGGAGAPFTSRLPVVNVGNIRITADLAGVQAMRGTHLLWQNSGIGAMNLQKGPGRWITVQGAPLGSEKREHPDSSFALISFVLDPQTGQIKARVGGQFVQEGAASALFLALSVRGVMRQDDAPLLLLTRLNLNTLHSEFHTLSGNQIIPAACRMPDHGADTGNIGISASFFGFFSPVHKQSVVWGMDTVKCTFKVRIDVNTFKVSLLSVNVNK
ncbi:hypothetical protein GCM10008957_11750 [Deinococcus ruber]|uniref:Lipid/polyisoprenoid-binding YceI-like domain-containing protein n=1 Tax=Deinococcus ruber TaxID=1848197 RepID=A0A918F259_9DEIO|nr:hypothetical protein GCM10008957_11750 [Deinococcus ruber]